MLVLNRKVGAWSACGLAAIAIVFAAQHFAAERKRSHEAARTATIERYLQAPLGFEANQGHMHADVRFFARGAGYTLFLTATDVVFDLLPSTAGMSTTTDDQSTLAPATIRATLVGANRHPRIAAEGKLGGSRHYLLGNDAARWSRDVEHFGKVRYEGIYPGIDALYYGNQKQVEYDFLVSPHADPRQIRIDFSGVDSMRLDEGGDLILTAGNAQLVHRKPVSYQVVDGQQRSVESRYRLLPDHQVEFEIGNYDRSRLLTIDPIVWGYQASFGGTGYDTGSGIDVDDKGYIYVTGRTASLDYPTTQSALQPQHRGGTSSTPPFWPYDVFVSKIDPVANVFVYSTYLGGTGDDSSTGIVVNSDGSAVITGTTQSSDFPLADAWQSQKSGGSDAFIARLSADGTSLVYSSYLGGSGTETTTDVARDIEGNVYVTGSTTSADFPATPGALQNSTAEARSGFVTKVDSVGAIQYSTYIPDSAGSAGIAIDSTGAAYVTGTTNLDTRPYNYVSKISPAGDALIYRSPLPLEGNPAAIAVDAEGSAYIVGKGQPVQINTSRGPTLSACFICKLSPNGDEYRYCNHAGHNSVDYVSYQRLNGVAVDDQGNAYVSGSASPYGGFIQSIAPSGDVNDWPFRPRTAGIDGGPGFAMAMDAAGDVHLLGTPFNPGGTGDIQVLVASFAPQGWRVVGSGDVDGDQRADLFWHNKHWQHLHAWKMAGALAESATKHAIPWQYRLAASADFNGDGRTDLLWRDVYRTSVWIWQAETDGTFSVHFVDVHPPAGWEIVGAGDMDGDRNADILWHNPQLEQVDTWSMHGAQRLDVNTQYVPHQYEVAAVGDFNGDRRTDLLWQDIERTTLWIWQADGRGFAIHYLDAFPATGWKIVGTGDVDGDQRSDVIWHNVAMERVDWWLMAGASRLDVGSKYVSSHYRIAAIDDFDGDGLSDVIWRDEGLQMLWMWQAKAGAQDFDTQYVGAHPTPYQH